MSPLKETKIVAQSEGADSRAHIGPLDLENTALVKGTGWDFPYMDPLKETKTVAHSEGADS